MRLNTTDFLSTNYFNFSEQQREKLYIAAFSEQLLVNNHAQEEERGEKGRKERREAKLDKLPLSFSLLPSTFSTRMRFLTAL
ncbi:MAG: hypothetical protein ACP5IM_06660 [Candidatus Bathyarchaeia archaeon]